MLHATSPVSPPLTRPTVCDQRSHIDSPLPSSFHPPSTWYEAVALPQRKSFGKSTGFTSIGFVVLLGPWALARAKTRECDSNAAPVIPAEDFMKLRRLISSIGMSARLQFRTAF